MGIAKKVIKGSLEIVKESAKQLVDTLSPTALLEQALGSKPKREDEFAKYLKGLGGDLSKEQIEQKRVYVIMPEEIKAIEQKRVGNTSRINERKTNIFF